MIIISFDVGIRNLAYVIINVDEENNNSHNIIDWNVLDLCEKEKKACNVDNITIGINTIIYFNHSPDVKNTLESINSIRNTCIKYITSANIFVLIQYKNDK